jgi:hypothetical protein
MPRYEYHPDGTVYFFPDSGPFYADTLANGSADAGFGLPVPVAPAITLVYTPGVGTRESTASSLLPLDPTGNARLDQVLANIPALIDTQMARTTPPAPTLGQLKALALAAVAARTAQLLAAGFPYSGLSYPLDLANQGVWLGMARAADTGILPYPVQPLSVSGVLGSLPDQASVDTFFATGFARAATILNGGAALAVQILAAPDAATLAAISDTRT